MVEWYLNVNRALREIRKKSLDALTSHRSGDEGTAKVVKGYLKADYENLRQLWEANFDTAELGHLGRYRDFLDSIPQVPNYGFVRLWF